MWGRLLLMPLVPRRLDGAVKRRSVSREDLRRLRSKASALIASGMMYAKQASAGGKSQAEAEGIARLKASRRRLRLRSAAVEDTRPRDGVALGAGQRTREHALGPPLNTGAAARPDEPSVDAAESRTSGQETAPLATRLLDSKRKRHR